MSSRLLRLASEVREFLDDDTVAFDRGRARQLLRTFLEVVGGEPLQSALGGPPSSAIGPPTPLVPGPSEGRTGPSDWLSAEPGPETYAIPSLWSPKGQIPANWDPDDGDFV